MSIDGSSDDQWDSSAVEEGGAEYLLPNGAAAATSSLVRLLLPDSDPPPGRAVLTVLYLCVLALCFAVPVFYYCRMHCEERQLRRLRDLELAGISHALAQSQYQDRHESRAARRKFREERKARIHQLFGPVKMILSADNFPHLGETEEGADINRNTSTKECTETDENDDIESGTSTESPSNEDSHRNSDTSLKSIDEDQLAVEIPSPGFQFASAAMPVGQLTNRQIPNLCSICLCNYYPGNTIVWSSNEACEHAFHEQCISQWLMKQRDGPLCPCCRRDFVIDPYDVDDEDPSSIFMAPIDEDTEDEVEIQPQQLQHQPTSHDDSASSLGDAETGDADPAMVAEATVAQQYAIALHTEESV